jgi:hypothetical protein
MYMLLFFMCTKGIKQVSKNILYFSLLPSGLQPDGTAVGYKPTVSDKPLHHVNEVIFVKMLRG